LARRHECVVPRLALGAKLKFSPCAETAVDAIDCLAGRWPDEQAARAANSGSPFAALWAAYPDLTASRVTVARCVVVIFRMLSKTVLLRWAPRFRCLGGFVLVLHSYALVRCRRLVRMTRAPRSNVELTGRRRKDGLAVRPMMKQGGRTAKLACRWRSG